MSRTSGKVASVPPNAEKYRRALSALCIVLVTSGVPARAGALVAPGDVLRIAVTDAPELNREAPVDADGRIMLQQVGAIPVAGLDLEGARARIETAIMKHDILRSPDVMVEVATYRPFYVGGAVAHPGAVPFTLGLTARHAIILVGGIDRSNGPDRLSATDLLDLRAKWEGNAFAVVQVESRIARLQAELGGLAKPDFSTIGSDVAKPAEKQAIIDLNAGLFDDRRKQSRSSQIHLKTGLDLADLEIDLLGKQASLEQNEEDIQKDQVEKTRILLAKGLVPVVRLQELERQKSQISRDLLENRAFAARARQGKETIRYELDVAEASRRIEIRGDLADALGERAKLKAESDVLASALLAAGIAIAGPGSDEPAEPVVTIHRLIEGRKTVLGAAMDTPIAPGDVLEVAIARRPRE